MGKEEQYWLEQLAGKVNMSSFPVHCDNPHTQGYERGTEELACPKQLYGALTAISKGSNYSLFVILLAATQYVLSRYTNEQEVMIGMPVFDQGEDAEAFHDILPLRMQIKDGHFKALLAEAKRLVTEANEHQNYPIPTLAEQLNLAAGAHSYPFQTVVLLQPIHRQPDVEALKIDTVFSFERETDGLRAKLIYNKRLYDRDTIQEILHHIHLFLETALRNPDVPLKELPLFAEQNRHRVPEKDAARSLFRPVHTGVEEQAERHPDLLAVQYKERTLTYRELNEQANRLARHLGDKHGVKATARIGVKMRNDERALIALLGVLKSGAVCVPLPPNSGYSEELASSLQLLIADTNDHEWPMNNVLYWKEELEEIPFRQSENLTAIQDEPWEAAYVLHDDESSKATGGSIITHAQIGRYFEELNSHATVQEGEAYLSVSPYYTEAAIMEWLWPLTRGMKVVIASEDRREGRLNSYLKPFGRTEMDFGLFFFSSSGHGNKKDKYELIKETTKMADQEGFHAVWLPERHFHEFGGLFPNPSVLSAGLAMITEQIQLRSGSVVSPLHDPIRIAEEWSVVDNLSGGRVGLSFASGWHADDFVFRPETYEDRKNIMFQQIDELKRLWSGESVIRSNGLGKDVKVSIYPKPVQEELSIWVTAAGSEQTFIEAGKIGANLLTNLLGGQDIELLKKNIKAYRRTLAEQHFPAETGKVCVMLHTYMGNDEEAVKRKVREPFCNYLKSSIGLFKNLADTLDLNMDSMTDEDMDRLLDLAFEKYWGTAALFGTPEGCEGLVRRLYEAGVNEIGCLIDFGLDDESVMEGLTYLAPFQKQFKQQEREQNSETAGEQPIAMMHASSVTFGSMLQDEHSAEFLRSLRTIFLSGDSRTILTRTQAELARERTDASLRYLYPPATSMFDGIVYELDTRHPLRLPAASQAVVLNGEQQTVPVGGMGDVYVGGADALHKAGDRGFLRPDGSIQRLGSREDRIEAAGYRLFLTEWREALAQHPDLANVFVRRVEDEHGRARLEVYALSHKQLDPFKLKEAAEAYCAEAKCQAAVVMLKEAPVTASGQLDWAKLPKPSQAGPQSGEDDKIERTLRQLWIDVLGVEHIGLEDNFFDLGGHSLTATILLTRIQQALEVQVPIREAFNTPTIKALADYIRRQEKKGIWCIEPAEKSASYPLSSAQKRIYFVQSTDVAQVSYNEPFAVRIQGEIQTERVESTFRQLVSRHEILRTSFACVAGEYTQQVHEDIALELDTFDCCEERADEVIGKYIRPFDLDKAPLFRAALIRIDDNDHILLFDIHHIISDGTSMSILVRDFIRLYEGDSLEPLPIQYKDFAVWQDAFLRSDLIRKQEQYWLDTLAGELPRLKLPTDYPRPERQSFEGKTIPFHLDEDTYDGLTNICNQTGATLYMVLLAAYNILLSKYTNQEDIMIGSPIAGRPHPDLNQMLGMFVNTIILRNQPYGGLAFTEFLQQVRTNALDAYDNQDYPFEMLVGKLNLRPDLSRNPLVDTFFVLQNMERPAFSLQQIEITPYELEANIAKFDLSLEAVQSRDHIQCKLEYCTKLFEASTAERFVRDYKDILAAIINNPDTRLQDIQLEDGYAALGNVLEEVGFNF